MKGLCEVKDPPEFEPRPAGTTLDSLKNSKKKFRVPDFCDRFEGVLTCSIQSQMHRSILEKPLFGFSSVSLTEHPA